MGGASLIVPPHASAAVWGMDQESGPHSAYKLRIAHLKQCDICLKRETLRKTVNTRMSLCPQMLIATNVYGNVNSCFYL